MPRAHLADRGVVAVDGVDARAFLDGLLTCDLDRIGPGRARLGALLTPQGKILFDFIVFQVPDGRYLLDCPKASAPDLVKRLRFYKLRAKIAIDDLSEEFGVVAGWEGGPKPEASSVVAVAEDPRLPALGWRALVRSGAAEEWADASAQDYHARRIALGIPEGGKDFLYGEAFPHEALMDQLRGVDFDKGCYVGQEVVSRMEHRGTARTRLVPVVFAAGGVPEAGAEVRAGERALGTTGSAAQGRGLAMIRLDRAADALASGAAITAGGHQARLSKPEWVSFPFPGEPATPAR